MGHGVPYVVKKQASLIVEKQVFVEVADERYSLVQIPIVVPSQIQHSGLMVMNSQKRNSINGCVIINEKSFHDLDYY